jgi:hypothetical protein
MADSLANVGASARKRSLAAVDDWVNQPTDPFEIAAMRTLQSVGRRKEGAATQFLSSIGAEPFRKGAGMLQAMRDYSASEFPAQHGVTE